MASLACQLSGTKWLVWRVAQWLEHIVDVGAGFSLFVVQVHACLLALAAYRVHSVNRIQPPTLRIHSLQHKATLACVLYLHYASTQVEHPARAVQQLRGRLTATC